MAARKRQRQKVMSGNELWDYYIELSDNSMEQYLPKDKVTAYYEDLADIAEEINQVITGTAKERYSVQRWMNKVAQRLPATVLAKLKRRLRPHSGPWSLGSSSQLRSFLKEAKKTSSLKPLRETRKK